MQTSKSDYQTQTQTQVQSTPQAQSGYKKPSQAISGIDGPIPSQGRISDPSSPNSHSALSSLLAAQFKKIITAAALALGVAIGAWLFIDGAPSSQEPEPSQTKIQERTQQYQQLLAQTGGAISVVRVQEGELRDALATIASDHDRQKLANQMEQKQTTLVWVTLWDTMAEDGDVVRVSSDGFSQEVPILHQPTRVAVPLPTSGQVAVTGSHDGGGGITVGILSGTHRIPIPYMRVGQTINIPISAAP